MAPKSILAALELLANRPPLAVEIEPGDRDAPKQWALGLFGADCRPLVLSAQGHSPIRPLERDVIVEIDLFFPESPMVDLLERAAARGVSARLRWADGVPIGGTEHHRVCLAVPLRLSNPLVLPPAPETIALSAVSGTDLETCSVCGARHWIRVARKPYPGAERSSFKEACRRCWQGTFTVDAWDDFRVYLVDERS